MTATSAEPASVQEHRQGEIRVKHRQHWSWWVLVAFVALCAGGVIKMLVTNPNLQWGVVADYFFTARVLRGVLMTLQLTVLAMLLGILLGIVTAVMRLSPIRILSSVAWAYTWFFRGTPLLVQIIFWFNLGALFPTIDVGLPLTGPVFFSEDSNVLITPFVAALLGLALNEGAYMSEIVRGGILSVDHGQNEAAAALGMRSPAIMRRIVLPQAMRVIVPPTGNQVISMLKSTALVSVTSTAELLFTVQQVYNQNFQTIPLLIVASLWYLIITSILSVGQYYLERRFARGSRKALPSTPLQRVRRSVGTACARVSTASVRSAS